MSSIWLKLANTFNILFFLGLVKNAGRDLIVKRMKRARYDAFFWHSTIISVTFSTMANLGEKKFMNLKLFNSFRRTNVAKRWAMALWHPRLGRFLVSPAPSSSHCLAHLGLFERLTNKAKRYILLTWVEIWKRYYNSLASDKLRRFRLTFSSALRKKPVFNNLRIFFTRVLIFISFSCLVIVFVKFQLWLFSCWLFFCSELIFLGLAQFFLLGI